MALTGREMRPCWPRKVAVCTGEGIGEALRAFPVQWPRNFCAAFWCEICLAQPVARSVMKAWHTRQERNGQKDIVQNGEIYEG